MTLKIKLSETKVKAIDEGTGEITGYASTFGNIDSYGDSIAPGAFTDTLARHSADDSPIPLLFEHDRKLDSHIGEITEAKEDDTGLWITARLDMDSDAGQRAFKLAKGRRVNGMSIGFIPTDLEAGTVQGKSANIIKGIELCEISLVLNPADAQARVTAVKSSDLPENIVRRAGLVAKANALTPPEVKVEGSLADHLNELVYEAKSLATRPDSTTELADKLSAIDAMREKIADGERKAANLRALGQLEYDDNPRSKEEPHMPKRLATKAAERTTAARTLAADLATKSVAGTSLMVPVQQSTEILPLERTPLVLLSEIPTAVVDSPSFSYLRQNARDLNAAVVPTGQKKPTSELGFERVDETLQVVAHLVPNIDEYILEDVQALESFISSEMISGVLESVEGMIVNAANEADGVQVQTFTDDVFTTTRHAKTKLSALSLTPAYFVMSHNDWAMLETTRETGSGAFVFNSAPVDQTNGTLWGVPVIATTHVQDGGAKLLATDSVGLWTDGELKVQSNRSAENFEKNEVTFRAEGRFKPGVVRAAGVVEIELEAQDAA